MAQDQGTLSYYDRKNPTSYERRLGYAAPDDAWFADSQIPGKPDAMMAYKKERFMVGFNLTIHDYLSLRKDVAKKALKYGRQDKAIIMNKKPGRTHVAEVLASQRPTRC